MFRTFIFSFFELLVSFSVGTYLYLKPETKELGQITLVMGLILVIHRLLISFEVSTAIKNLESRVNGTYLKMVKPLETISKIIDVTSRSDPDFVNSILSEYLQIKEERLTLERKKIVDDAIINLKELRISKRTSILEEPDFYSWLYREFDQALPGAHIKIVSMDEELEWSDTPQEKAYFQRNLKAAQRGVLIERIFLFSSNRLAEAANNQFIKAHSRSIKNSLQGHYVDRDTFAKVGPSALRDAGQGFILFGNEFAIVDVFSSDGQARGYVTFKSEDIKKYSDTFERFKSVSSELDFR